MGRWIFRGQPNGKNVVSLPDMALEVCSINSGSNGNCYYVGNASEAILIDAGISCREIEKRMVSSGLSMPRIKAVFISHEHSDHIRGLNTLAKKHGIPVYITAPTFRSGGLDIDPSQLRSFINYEPVRIGTLSVTAFPKLHDASDPCSFIISCGETRVGVFTDIGFPCAHVIRNFSQCHAAFLEANYDTTMLTKGNYPYHLKKRISGGKGHLSNDQAFALFKHHRPSYMTHLFLSHLSAHNNDPQLVADLFQPYQSELKIVVASRYEASPVYQISPSFIPVPALPKAKPSQLSLFA